MSSKSCISSTDLGKRPKSMLVNLLLDRGGGKTMNYIQNNSVDFDIFVSW